MVDKGNFSGRSVFTSFTTIQTLTSVQFYAKYKTLASSLLDFSGTLGHSLLMDAHGDKVQVLQIDQNSGVGCWEADCGSGKWLVGPLVAQDAAAFVMLIIEQALDTIFAFFHKSKNPLQFSFSYWKQVSIEVFLKVKWCNTNFWKARDTCCIKSILGGREINVESTTESSLLPKTHQTCDMSTRQVQDSRAAWSVHCGGEAAGGWLIPAVSPIVAQWLLCWWCLASLQVPVFNILALCTPVYLTSGS